MADYEMNIRNLHFSGAPVEVNVRMKMLSIDSIDTVNMDFSLDVFLTQQWVDERLDHGTESTITVNYKDLDKIWLPDTYFVNAKDSSFHYVTNENKLLQIGPNGLVSYRIRISLKAACQMDLRLFPMDKQICPLFLESYGYHNKKVAYRWATDNGNSFIDTEMTKLPQFTLKAVNLSSKINRYYAGNYTCLSISFKFDRMYSYFLIHVYGPCALIVMMSWLSFLIPRNHTPARISLGITALLTTVTVLNMSNNSMPKVNYIKALDKYLIGCFMFVFSVLAEYSIILTITGKIRKRRLREEEKAKKHAAESDTDDAEMPTYRPLSDYAEKATTKQYYNSMEAVNKKDWRKFIAETIFTEDFLVKIDEYARIAFPVSFALFNALYFGTYIS
ncbi:gamma-aminobutyric acid receptor subunit beta-2-like isoform X2 [Dendronephthya gigantea]|uniref:gamma-aminobutyric acid receptor subunit beta-2-like isoform X2 n=1 Tax=Dendronephthya gigantea TaxID=151771 RepID=UPI001068ECBA|nr:gamma-aminobutyric acid receptor subunit beta-2-like isoform X2 [Dendronephthya gigantea]